jgi:UTP--glucose-1-phosphate uridylyltransferase
MVREVAKMAHVVSVRQKQPLGLGHAVLVARRYVGKEPFAVLLGDVIIDAPVPCTKQLLDVYATHGPVIALLAVPPEKTHLYGVIAGKQIEKGLYHVEMLVEKPAPGTAPTNLSVLGRYVLPPEIFDILERTAPGKGGEIQLTDGLQTLAKRAALYGLETEGKLYDAGDRVGFIEATVAFALKRPALAAELKPVLRRLLDC